MPKLAESYTLRTSAEAPREEIEVNAKRFSTERIRLRALEKKDVGALGSYLNDPCLIGRRYLPWEIRDVAPLSEMQGERILEEWGKETKGFTLGVELRESGDLVGHAGCRWRWDTHCPDVFVVVSPAHQRQGIGSEAVRLLLGYLFGETPAHSVNSWVASWNDGGLAFARSIGFTESGRIPRSGLRDGRWVEEVMIDLLRREWFEREGGSDGA